MDINLLTRNADDLIRKVVSRYNQLYAPAGTVSQLELDLMLDDLRKLYDTFKIIAQVSLTQQNTVNRSEVSVNTKVTSESQNEPAKAPSIKEETSPAPEKESPLPEPQAELVMEPEVEPEPETHAMAESEIKPAQFENNTAAVTTPDEESGVPEAEDPLASADTLSPQKESVKTTASNDPDPGSAMLADRFNTSNKMLSESMASSQPQSVVGSRLLLQPISDLTTGIGLNDKFNFINELFGNNPLQYEEAIIRINKAVNNDEAGWILHKYHTSDWDQKADTLARLKDFIKRRFI